ncbi:MAG: DUF4406 domain-containing protein [Elusimicrobiaceae bacterium]|nr:DUF4406 domain-containing protein [Elusimicrobiaceae bacterium]MBR4355383.1 DUF4406 domain-containing protein [Elusimicrobiaceae bacterium]
MLQLRNISKDQVIYLSGPMTGLPDYNRPAFDLRAKLIREAGYTVNNPAEISRKHGLDKPYAFFFREAMRMLLQSDVIYVFGDVTKSEGSQMEIKTAKMAEIPVVWEGCLKG